MTTSTRCWCLIAPLLCCLGFAAPAGAVDLVGQTVAVFQWSAAPGPVDYYQVEVNRNDRGYRFATICFLKSLETRIRGSYGDTIQVRIRAVSHAGERGPYSEPSEIVRFVAPGAPADDPPADDPPADDPPADELPPRNSAELLDFNDDGSAELLIRNSSSGDIELWLLADSSPGWVQAESLAPTFEIVGNGDYDGDGYADLLARDSASGDLEIRLLENGETVETGSFQIDDPNQDVVGSADYDGNGYADFLLRDRSTGELQFWSLHGTDVLEIVPLSAADADAEIVGSGDHDGDGQHEILWLKTSLYRSGLFVWHLDDDPANPVEEDTPYSVPWGYQIVGTGDYDGDGASDVLLRHEVSGWFRMYLSGAPFSSAQPVTDGGLIPFRERSSYSVVGNADFDGDGSCDIALRHASGGLLLLYMQGSEALRGLSVDISQSWSVDGVGTENAATD